MKGPEKAIFWIALCLLALPFHAFSRNDTPECFKRLERNFFKEQDLAEAFSLHRLTVPQSQWNAIYRTLKRQSEQIPSLLRARAARMNPNPLSYPFQAEQAKALLFDVLYAVFEQVMQDFNVTNHFAIQDMFNYLLQKQQLEIDSCFKSV